MEILNVHCDGGSRGNPGPAACAFIVKNLSGETLYQEGKFLGKMTNNQAEYLGVITTLEWLTKNQGKFKETSKINFFLDSKLTVNQLNGLFKIKDASLRDLIFKIKILEREIKLKIYYHLVSRVKNKEADRVLNQTLDRVTSGK